MEPQFTVHLLTSTLTFSQLVVCFYYRHTVKTALSHKLGIGKRIFSGLKGDVCALQRLVRLHSLRKLFVSTCVSIKTRLRMVVVFWEIGLSEEMLE